MAYQNRQPPEGINNVTTGWQKDFFLLVAGFFIGLALITWLLLTLLGWSARWVPFSWEQSLSGPLNEQIQASPQRDYLQTLAQGLAQAGGLNEDLSISVHYQESKTLNAFATLGGHLFILEGLTDELESEQALAFVIAHEIAHIEHRHPLQAATRQLGVSLMLGLVFGRNDLATMVSSGGQLALLNYSREQEREADAWALAALDQYYGHVGGADALFHLLARKREEEKVPPAWLSTHPHNQKRIQNLKRMSEAQGYPVDGPLTPLPDLSLNSSER